MLTHTCDKKSYTYLNKSTKSGMYVVSELISPHVDIQQE